MKKLTLTLLLLALPAFADAASLKDNMKAIGTLFKAINASVNDRGQNVTNAGKADQMIALFQTVAKQVPDDISDLPQDQQAAALADYQRLINEEEQYAASLKADFLANDNAGAADILNKMALDKQEGHDKYNKD